ncbi:MAG: ABC-type transport auxiliary lipoprotein family protein [Pseudohongiella sp.]|uniref:ABC-type transport auxiliary lipoprotein family protein n=1 Tax=Pseudohongiella sp. TaxID=1979412 RepID=UPI0034A064A8
MIIRLLPVLVLLSGTIALSACQILPQRPEVALYQLPPSSIEAGPGASGATVSSLRLDRPGTSDALGSNRVLVLAADNSFEAYPGARWSAPVPVLWRDWLLDAFWRDGSIDQLSVSADGLQAQLELGGMLRAFHTEYRHGSTEALIRYDALLIDTRTRKIVASQRFDAREPAGANDAEAAVHALGVAADRLAEELIRWVVTTTP